MTQRLLLIFKLMTLLVFLLIVYLAIVFLVNRFSAPPLFEPLSFDQSGIKPISRSKSYQALSWNIGYAGMGKDSDFIMDGGTQYRPKNLDQVSANIKFISKRLEQSNADFIILQEVCLPSYNSWQVNVLSELKESLFDYENWFRPDLQTKLLPPPFWLRIGNATFSSHGFSSAELLKLPLEKYSMGCLRKNYRLHISRIAVESSSNECVFVNIHLSAFDEGALIRNAQLNILREFITSEYSKGNYVIIGGDWNLKLASTEFPHQSEEKHMFWVHDLPKEFTPTKWRWAVDPATATCRSAQQPYKEGENFQLIIDGFLVSPNVVIENVKTADLSFEHTDHHPVTITFSLQ